MIKDSYKQKIIEYRNYYKGEYIAKETWHILAFSFCICWLIIQALSSNYFRGNVMEFCSWINVYVTDTWKIIAEWTPAAAHIAYNIPNEIAYTIFYWLLFGIVGILLMAICYGLPLLVIGCVGYSYLTSKSFDRANRWVMIGTGIMLIALSSEMYYTPPMNILLIWFFIQVAVPIVRYIIIPLIFDGIDKIQNMNEDEKRVFYSNIMMIVVVIACIFFLMWTMKSCSASLERLSQ